MQTSDFQRRLTPTDLAFLRDVLGPDAPEDGELSRLLNEDEEYRAKALGDPRTFEAVTSHEETMTVASPRLFFEVLLRRAVGNLRNAPYTVERTGSDRAPVFDTAAVVELTEKPSILHYLATLLASFTKVHSHTERVWVRRGVVRKVRHSDLDVHSMLRLARETDEQERLPVYRRTADLCLFILGMFPDFAATAHRYPRLGRAASAIGDTPPVGDRGVRERRGPDVRAGRPIPLRRRDGRGLPDPRRACNRGEEADQLPVRALPRLQTRSAIRDGRLGLFSQEWSRVCCPMGSEPAQGIDTPRATSMTAPTKSQSSTVRESK